MHNQNTLQIQFKLYEIVGLSRVTEDDERNILREVASFDTYAQTLAWLNDNIERDRVYTILEVYNNK